MQVREWFIFCALSNHYRNYRTGWKAHLNLTPRHVNLSIMSTLIEIETAVDALPSQQQEELLRHLAERLRKRGEPKRRLPLVPATGRPITQEEIDDSMTQSNRSFL
ncbi:MAG: hypothetical protein HY360_02700 [Verrucomicrobia bacterium]|nr:hypothetical protein [Verrucomicrobiota bacterium]